MPRTVTSSLRVLAAVLLLSSTSPLLAATAPDPDPWQGFNRRMFAFNDRVDRYFLKPVARGYRAITPQFVDDGITNFLNNLSEPTTIVNDVLQGKLRQSAADTGRFVMNTTVGLAGFIDVARHVGLRRNQEDFGQTFAKWGLPAGPYVVLPFLPGMTLRDGSGRGTEAVLIILPRNRALDVGWKEELALTVLGVVDTRADLIPMEETLPAGDRYILLRDAYFQRRAFLINDGAVTSDPFLDDDFGGDDEDAATEPVVEPATEVATDAPAEDAIADGTGEADAAPATDAAPSSVPADSAEVPMP